MLCAHHVALNSLQGALGKTAGRSYKAAPRQLLQVDSNAAPGANTSPTLLHAHISKSDATHSELTAEGEGAARKAAEIGHEALETTNVCCSCCVTFQWLLRAVLI